LTGPFVFRCVLFRLRFEHSYDFKRPRIHDHDFTVDEEELISAPIGIDRDDFSGKRVEAHCSWDSRTDRDREVDIRRWLDVLLGDRRADGGALLC